jgi:hypothetical protein
MNFFFMRENMRQIRSRLIGSRAPIQSRRISRRDNQPAFKCNLPGHDSQSVGTRARSIAAWSADGDAEIV